MNLSRIRLITFDVTETLLRFRSSPGKQYGDIGAIYGAICNDHNLLSASFKQQWTKMNAEHPNYGKTTGLGWENWWKSIVYSTFEGAKLHLDNDKLDAISTHLIKIYESAECWQQSHGALSLLSYLKHLDIPLGVISNYDPRLHRVLVNTKLRHYFDFVLTSYEVGVAKPHPEIFKIAIKLSNIDNLKCCECLHIGNTPSFDYLGAKNSGWHAALVHNKDCNLIKEKYPYVDCAHSFVNLHDLHQHFIENNKKQLTQQNM